MPTRHLLRFRWNETKPASETLIVPQPRARRHGNARRRRALHPRLPAGRAHHRNVFHGVHRSAFAVGARTTASSSIRAARAFTSSGTRSRHQRRRHSLQPDQQGEHDRGSQSIRESAPNNPGIAGTCPLRQEAALLQHNLRQPAGTRMAGGLKAMPCCKVKWQRSTEILREWRSPDSLSSIRHVPKFCRIQANT